MVKMLSSDSLLWWVLTIPAAAVIAYASFWVLHPAMGA